MLALKTPVHRGFDSNSTSFGPQMAARAKVGTLIAKQGLGPFGAKIEARHTLMRVNAIYRNLIRRKFTSQQNLIFHIKSVSDRRNDSQVPNV
jgi:hypothetical protein